MTDARDLVAELHGLRAEREALAARIAGLGRYSSLRNQLCTRLERITRRVLQLETMAMPRAALPAPLAPAPDVPAAPAAADAYGGRQPYWIEQ